MHPDEVPLCESTKKHNRVYEEAEETGEPFLVIDKREQGYSLTYDLRPTGNRLTDDAQRKLEKRINTEVDSIIFDPEKTDELTKNISHSKGGLHFFENEQIAREVGVVISQVIFDETNREEEPSPEEQFSGEES
jgi:hypothetical protein